MFDKDEKKLIFCVSPGRSGSHYLSQVFGLASGVCSVHEPEHQFAKYAALKPHRWNLKNRRFGETLTERTKLKLWQIDDLLTSAKADIYVETNPMFSTLWHDVVLGQESYRDITVILLRRNPIRVLKSLLDLGWYSTRDGDTWMVSAYSVNSLFNPPCSESEASAADLVVGHLVNVELYANRISEACKTRGFNVVEAESSDLFTDKNSVRALVYKCGLDFEDQNLSRIGDLGRNKKTIKKKEKDTPLRDCAKYLDQYASGCEEPVHNLRLFQDSARNLG